MHDQVRQINMFSSVFLLKKAFRKKEQLATWLIDDRLIHLRTNLFFSIKLKINLSATRRNMCTYSLRAFIGVETAALTFRTKQCSTSYSSHICYGKRFYNDFFLNHHTIVALVNDCLIFLSCVVIETALDLIKKDQLS